MEEQLSQINFSEKNFIQTLIEPNKQYSLQQLESLFTDLHFNIQLVQSQQEEKIQAAQSTIKKNKEQVYAKKAQNIKLLEGIIRTLGSDKCNHLTKQQSSLLYEQIEQIFHAKNNASETLVILDQITSFEFQLQEIKTIQDQENFELLYDKVKILSESIILTQKLPQIDQRYEKSIAIQKQIISHCEHQLINNLQSCNKNNLCIIFNIYHSLHKEEEFMQLYINLHLEPNIQKFKHNMHALQPNDYKIIDMLGESLANEIDYLSEFFSQKLKYPTSASLLYLVKRSIEIILSQDIYKSILLHHPPKSILPLQLTDDNYVMAVESYLKIISLVKDIEHAGQYFIPEHMEQLNEVLFGLFDKKYIETFISLEEDNFALCIKQIMLFNDNNNFIFKDATGEDQQLFFAQFNEMILKTEIEQLPLIILKSFQAVYESTFGIGVIQWGIFCNKLCGSVFEGLKQRILQLEQIYFDQKTFLAIEDLMTLSRNMSVQSNVVQYLKGNKNIHQTFQCQKVNIQVLNTLFSFFSKLQIVYNQIEVLNYIISQAFNNNSAYQPEILHSLNNKLLQSISVYILKNNKSASKRKEKFTNALNKGELPFNLLLQQIESLLQIIHKIVIELFLSDNMKLMSIENSALYNVDSTMNCNEKDQHFSKNPSQQVVCVCQNFFLHIQMIEDQKPVIESIQKIARFVDKIQLNQQQKQNAQAIQNQNLYLTLSNNIQQEQQENIENIPAQDPQIQQRQFQMPQFWTSIYAYYFTRFYLFALLKSGVINGQHNVKQALTDLEYVYNVIQSFNSSSTNKYLEQTIEFLYKHIIKSNLNLEQIIF